MYPSLRAFVEKLDQAGELVRIRRECDPKLEIAEIANRAMKLPGMVGCLLPGDGFLSLKRAERFKPLLEVIDRYSAMVLVHYGKTDNDADPIKVDSSDNGHPRMGTLDMQARLSQEECAQQQHGQRCLCAQQQHD